MIEASLAGMHLSLTRLGVPAESAVLYSIRTIRAQLERAAVRPHCLLMAAEFTTVHQSMQQMREAIPSGQPDQSLVDGLLNIDYGLEPVYAEEYAAVRRNMGLTSVWRAGHVELDDVAFQDVKTMVYPCPPPLSVLTAAPPTAPPIPSLAPAAPHGGQASISISEPEVTWRRLWVYADNLIAQFPPRGNVQIQAITRDSQDPKVLTLTTD